MSDTAGVLTPHTLLRSGDVLDTYSTDDGTVVLVAGTSGHRVVRLSPLGHAVRSAVGTGRTLAEPRGRAWCPGSGPRRPEECPSLVRSAVLALVDEGVIAAGQGP